MKLKLTDFQCKLLLSMGAIALTNLVMMLQTPTTAQADFSGLCRDVAAGAQSLGDRLNNSRVIPSEPSSAQIQADQIYEAWKKAPKPASTSAAVTVAPVTGSATGFFPPDPIPVPAPPPPPPSPSGNQQNISGVRRAYIINNAGGRSYVNPDQLPAEVQPLIQWEE